MNTPPLLFVVWLFVLLIPRSADATSHRPAADAPTRQISEHHTQAVALQARLTALQGSQPTTAQGVELEYLEVSLRFAATFLRYAIILDQAGLERHRQRMTDLASIWGSLFDTQRGLPATPSGNNPQLHAMLQDMQTFKNALSTATAPGLAQRGRSYWRHIRNTPTCRFIIPDILFALETADMLAKEPHTPNNSQSITAFLKATANAFASILAQSALGYDAVVSPPRNARQRKAVRQVMALAQAEIDQSRNALAALAQDQTTSQAVRNMARFARHALEEYGVEQRKTGAATLR